MSGPVRVAIVEDGRDLRDGLVALIDGTPGFACAGAFDCMETALDDLGRRPPDVALVDLGLPRMPGIDGIRALKARHPDLPIVVLTVYEDDERIFGALCAGACGYLLKKTPPERLIEGIRDAMAGGSPVSPEVARRMIALFRDVRPPDTAGHQLTPHEVRVLRLLVEGHNYKTAAVELNVSVNTIAFHMKHIYEKLHVHSKSEAVSKALRSGILL